LDQLLLFGLVHGGVSWRGMDTTLSELPELIDPQTLGSSPRRPTQGQSLWDCVTNALSIM
jgi:hypothetical protein